MGKLRIWELSQKTARRGLGKVEILEDLGKYFKACRGGEGGGSGRNGGR